MEKICPNQFPVSSDWDEDLKEEERKDQDKREDNNSLCLQTVMKILKNNILIKILYHILRCDIEKGILYIIFEI